jgi:hypothetical protein
LLIKELQDVADGKTDRLMVCMPPGSAKSTYASVRSIDGICLGLAYNERRAVQVGGRWRPDHWSTR